MMVTSLSFTYTQVSAAAPATATRQRAPEPQAQPVARDEGRRASDTPQRSPMYRALKEALAAMAQTAASAGASQPSAADATRTEKAAADDAPAPDLDEALANFAQALMQALRDPFGSRRDGDSEHGDGHHHHHHHGRRGWGDPAQRVDALAQQVGATASAAADSSVPAPATAAAGSGSDTAAAAASAAVPAKATAPSTEPVQAADAAAVTVDADVGSRITINVTLNIMQGRESTAARSPFQGLLDAFARLQKALGQPADDADALPQRLSAFLQALADKLRGEEAASTDVATQPGTLISVTA